MPVTETPDSPCSVCGGIRRYSDGHCAACAYKRTRAYAVVHRDRGREYGARWTAAWREKNHSAYINYRAAYRAKPKIPFLERQGYQCAICGREDRLVLDHCHLSGENRGALCSDCNVALGLFNDHPELLRQAALYLETHG